MSTPASQCIFTSLKLAKTQFQWRLADSDVSWVLVGLLLRAGLGQARLVPLLGVGLGCSVLDGRVGLETPGMVEINAL